MNLRDRVRLSMRQAAPLRAGDELLIGVSGGPDSVTLLHVLTRLAGALRVRLCAVHVDHQLRVDSAEDATFVKRLAASWHVPCVVAARDVRAWARREKRSLEDAARQARYEAFREVARRRSASWLALAHTADDQAETVCMRLLRGAGLTGLSGMAPLRRFESLSIIRPLLGVWRHEIMAYVREHRLTIRQDPTNADRAILRNRIRLELLPLLEREYNPNMRRLLVQLAEQCRLDASYLEAAARRQWKRLARVRNGEVHLRLSAWAHQPEALRRQLIRLAIRELQGDLTAFEHRHWDELEDLCAGRPNGAVVDLPNRLQAQRQADALILRQHGRPIERTPSVLAALAPDEPLAVY